MKANNLLLVDHRVHIEKNSVPNNPCYKFNILYMISTQIIFMSFVQNAKRYLIKCNNKVLYIKSGIKYSNIFLVSDFLYICDDDEISISFVCDISAHIIVVADFVGGIVWS